MKFFFVSPENEPETLLLFNMNLSGVARKITPVFINRDAVRVFLSIISMGEFRYAIQETILTLRTKFINDPNIPNAHEAISVVEILPGNKSLSITRLDRYLLQRLNLN
jgi:hypothetical protein